ncbi:MAG: hypothetical protein PWP23_3284, partial [Candidatus Sumerlaeota bacterium]|nr:hypothetical protein [Candidatus Sumerlaeota bacterium]
MSFDRTTFGVRVETLRLPRAARLAALA